MVVLIVLERDFWDLSFWDEEEEEEDGAGGGGDLGEGAAEDSVSGVWPRLVWLKLGASAATSATC